MINEMKKESHHKLIFNKTQLFLKKKGQTIKKRQQKIEKLFINKDHLHYYLWVAQNE